MPRDLGRQPCNLFTLTPHLLPLQLIIPQEQHENWKLFCGKIVSLACRQLSLIADFPKIERLRTKRRQAMDPTNPFPWWQVRKLDALNICSRPRSQPYISSCCRYSHARRQVPFDGRLLTEYAPRIQTAMFITPSSRLSASCI